jgi:hypothetical protein
MGRVLRSPATAVWVVLVLATLLAARLSEAGGSAAVAVVLIASVKILLVMSEFMELRTAPPVWRWLAGGWLVLVAAVVLGGHVLG